MSKSRVKKNKELYNSLDTNDANGHGLDLNSFELEDLSDIVDPTIGVKKEVETKKKEVNEDPFELEDLSDLEEEFKKIDAQKAVEVEKPEEGDNPPPQEVVVSPVVEASKQEVKPLPNNEEYLIEQPISYNDMLRAEEVLRAKLEKQKELKDSKRGIKKSPVTDTYTAEMMQKNINQYEGVDVRKELNIKIRRAGNKRAILALSVLLVMIIAVGIALSVIILRS